MGVRVVTGRLYLRGFIGEKESDKAWLSEKVVGWTHLVEVLAGVAIWHPQKYYDGLQKYLHQEWALVQHVTPHTGEELHPVEEDLGK